MRAGGRDYARVKIGRGKSGARWQTAHGLGRSEDAVAEVAAVVVRLGQAGATLEAKIESP